jgi:Domain of unknown function (DUF4332)
MTQLSQIPGIGKSSLELLEAAGFSDVEALAKAGVEELAQELDRANTILQIAKRAPARANVQKWIDSARNLTGAVAVAVEEVKMPVDHEKTPEVAAMLEQAPFAIPLPARVLREQQLAVGDIPAAILLNRYSGDLEVKVDDRGSALKDGRPAPGSSNGARLEIDVSRIKSVATLAGPAPRTRAASTSKNDDRVALIRTPRVETNKGRNPQSRLYIRGVLHSHPISLGLGAFLTLVLAVMLPVGIISAGLLFLSGEVPQYFNWVPKWLLAFPASLPVVGIAWLIWGMHGSCRICGQKLFVPKMCLKNTKAHHIPGLGNIIPVCVHILLFKWFRCTYCGTPVRLKK